MSMDPAQLALLTDELARDEGEILHAYQDSRGYWTIGVGTLIDQRAGGGITVEESRYLLSHRIASAEADLDKHLPWWRGLTPTRQRVLLNMCFNMGIGDATRGLLSFHGTLAAIRAGQYNDAADEMMKSRWAGQVGDRAKRLAEMMRQG